jgi:chemotaxis methyl-accepting protein methylase
MLSRALGIDLGAFRPDHVASRLSDLLIREGIPDVATLIRAVGSEPALRSRVRRSIAISVTRAGRDAEQLAVLARHLPPAARVGRPLRVWSAGCSTGEEVRDFAELLHRRRVPVGTLLGSDLLRENVEAARRHHRDLRGARWEVRDVVAEGPPAGAWHLVVCRNVAIYLTSAAKRRLHQTLAGALGAGGLLLLGRSERLDDASALGVVRVGPHVYLRPA